MALFVPLISALFHLYQGRFQATETLDIVLRKRHNPLRWVEFGISKSLMVMINLRIAGEVSILALLVNAALTCVMMVFANELERSKACCSCCGEPDPNTRTPKQCRQCRQRKSSYYFYLSILFGLIPWIYMLVLLYSTSIEFWGYEQYGVMGVFFHVMFILAMNFENEASMEFRPRQRYSTTEYVYMLLVFLWKLSFAIHIYLL
jgi:hypothetical protein